MFLEKRYAMCNLFCSFIYNSLFHILQQPRSKRTIFISLHDTETEGQPSYDMRWLHGESERFSTSVNHTDSMSAISQLILRGGFQNGKHMWNPDSRGKPQDMLAFNGPGLSDDVLTRTRNKYFIHHAVALLTKVFRVIIQ